MAQTYWRLRHQHAINARNIKPQPWHTGLDEYVIKMPYMLKNLFGLFAINYLQPHHTYIDSAVVYELYMLICNHIILTLMQLLYMNRTCKNLELTHASSTRSKRNTNLINKFQIEVLRNHFDEYYAILHDWEPDSMMGWIYCTERSCSIIVKYLYGFNISFYSEGDWQMLLNMTVAKALFDCEGVLASILS
jgi:hypothetical protein